MKTLVKAEICGDTVSIRVGSDDHLVTIEYNKVGSVEALNVTQKEDSVRVDVVGSMLGLLEATKKSLGLLV